MRRRCAHLHRHRPPWRHPHRPGVPGGRPPPARHRPGPWRAVRRDPGGWARLRLRFERDADGVARQLLQLGAGVEVLEPPELRERLAGIASGLAELYRRRD
ncbi:MAG: WYL domain-containing protein [Acidimicrobiia bacterium]